VESAYRRTVEIAEFVEITGVLITKIIPKRGSK
jgi:hypothetical protein